MDNGENQILGTILMKVNDGPWVKLASMPKFETEYDADDTHKTYISKRSSFTGTMHITKKKHKKIIKYLLESEHIASAYKLKRLAKKNKTRRLFK